MKVPMYDRKGNLLEEIPVAESVFGVEGSDALVHAAVIRHLANGRQGSASTKTRSEVVGGGRKPWRQKGTGRARHGSIRSPIWRGGGVTFGPQPRDFGMDMPRKSRRRALLLALSAKMRAGGLLVVDDLAITEPKTKALVEMLRSLGGETVSTLIVTATREPNVTLSVRNLARVRAIEARNVNVYDVVKYERVLLTRAALAALEEVLAS
jgi:large subunit ribosomal protein L4